jgi:hypothetical protein
MLCEGWPNRAMDMCATAIHERNTASWG